MAAKRATAPHLRLASVDGLPIKGRRSKRRFAASDLSCRLSSARMLAGDLAMSCERAEKVMETLFLATHGGDPIVICALAREALTEISGTAHRLRHVATLIGGEA